MSFYKQKKFNEKIDIAINVGIYKDDWNLADFNMIENFANFQDFINYIVEDHDWYKKYLINFSNKDLDFDIDFEIANICNRLKRETKLSEFEHEQLFYGWEYIVDRSFLLNYCPNCNSEIRYFPRFPQSLCDDCMQLITDSEGNKLKIGLFTKLSYENDKEYNSNICFLGSQKYKAVYHSFDFICLMD